MAAPASVSVKFPIQQLFPKDGYKEAAKANKSIIPHYLIALKQPTETILNAIGKNASYQDPTYRLSLLAVATIAQHYPVMEALLKMPGVDPASEDVALFTPLHYAHALEDQKAIDMLSAAMKVKKMAHKAFKGWNEMTHSQYPADSDVVFAYKDETGQITPGTASKFRELTGARFFDGITTDQAGLIYHMVDRLTDPASTTDATTVECARHLAEKLERNGQPKLYVGPDGKANLGLFNQTRLRSGQALAIYAGKLAEKNDTLEYSLGDFHADKVGNVARMANHGFPNIFPCFAITKDSKTSQVYVAIEDIPANSGIYWDYGWGHEVQRGPSTPLNLEAMEAFFRSKGPLARLEAISRSNGSNTIEGVLKTEGQLLQLSYIFHSQNALFYLILKGIVSSEEFGQCLRHPNLSSILRIPSEKIPKHLSEVANKHELAREIEAKLSRCSDPALRKEYLDEFFRLLENYGSRFMRSYTICGPQFATIEAWKARDVSVYEKDIATIACIAKIFADPNKKTVTEGEIQEAKRLLQAASPAVKGKIEEIYGSNLLLERRDLLPAFMEIIS